MNTDEKQFSVNRVVSKKQILITSLFAVTLALVFGTGEAEAAPSAFASTSAGASEATSLESYPNELTEIRLSLLQLIQTGFHLPPGFVTRILEEVNETAGPDTFM